MLEINQYIGIIIVYIEWERAVCGELSAVPRRIFRVFRYIKIIFNYDYQFLYDICMKCINFKRHKPNAFRYIISNRYIIYNIVQNIAGCNRIEIADKCNQLTIIVRLLLCLLNVYNYSVYTILISIQGCDIKIIILWTYQ